jgi:RimJ/RimL family protein N-acetyltransferase
MTNNVWQGALVRLRALQADDWAAFHAFDTTDTEMARLSWRIHFPRTPEQAKRWAAQEEAAPPMDDNVRLVVETVAGEVAGTINVNQTDSRNGTFAYGLALGAAHRRKGFATETIRLVLAHYFGELRYQKVNVRVYAFNEPSIRLHEKLGFQREGRLRRMIFSRGVYHDEILFGLTAEEFAAATWSNA